MRRELRALVDKDYLAFLADNDRRRAEILRDLLKNANRDGMTPEDLIEVRAALTLVEGRIGTPAERRGHTLRKLDDDEEH